METVVKLDQVTFAYPADTGEPSTPVLSGASAELPAGLVSFVGQNGYGKSTLLLLAGARLIPDEGSVTVLGTSTRSFQGAREDAEIEEERNRLVSFVYQNMEFESSESVGDLMEFVYKNGFHDDKSLDLLQSIRKELQLDPFLGKRTQDLAKGNFRCGAETSLHSITGGSLKKQRQTSIGTLR